MDQNFIRSILNRRAFMARFGWLAAASAAWPETLTAFAENAAPTGAPHGKPYGSGYFGEWITDQFDLPAFHYTCDQLHDPKAVSATDPAFRAPTDQSHQVGNDRLVGVVSNYGYVQVRQDEGAPKFLNDYAPERGQFGGGIGFLTDGKVNLSTFYPGTGESFDRIFGIGYLRKKVAGHGYDVDQVIFAPFGDDPVMLSQVTITNHGKSAAALRWVEYWGCQVYQFSYRSWMQASSWNGVSAEGSPGKAVEYRRKFGDRFAHHFERIEGGAGLIESKRFLGRTAEDERLWQAVQDASATASTGDFTSIPDSIGGASLEDLHPPSTFLASLDAPPTAVYTNARAFFGSGGVLRPVGLERGLDADLTASGPESALLLERRVTLDPGQSRTLYFLYGYLPQGFEAAALVKKYQSGADQLWANSSRAWKESGLRLTTPSEPWVERETTWSHYYLRSNSTYDDFFEEHILSQSGEYQYPWGFQGAARDPLQHALPFVYSEPRILKEVLRYTLKEVRPNGSIPYSITGHGMQMPSAQDDNSDLPLWLLWAASEYVLGTRDVEFLDEEIPYNMVFGPTSNRASVRSLLALCYRHLAEDVGTGPHHLIRMLMDDWNDGLVFEGVPHQYRAEYIREGESVFNSGMAGYIYDHYARMLEYAGDEGNLRAELQQNAEECRQAVRAQWTGRWFRRAWLGPHAGWLGSQDLWMEHQPWTIISGAATSEQARTLAKAIDELLRQPSAIGAVSWSRGPGAPSEPGKGEWVPPANWINVAPALDGALVWSLTLVDSAMAWDEWKKSSLARHAEAYPDVWYGVWSGPDSCNGPEHKFPGRLTPSDAALGKGKNDFSVLDFPVLNMHSHSWPLYSAAKLFAIEFTAKGISLRATLPVPTYQFSSALVGLEKSAAGYEGWYAPRGRAGTWTVTITLPGEEAGKVKSATVNGAETAIRRAAGGAIEITGESTPEKPLRWALRA